mmetsp:Transcript_9366/g.33165  ORF Transcript_9366/g.33165 Transcript_9366/m.33165 type:complete len:320 (-) Transcript_9366:1361-2320(-)
MLRGGDNEGDVSGGQHRDVVRKDHLVPLTCMNRRRHCECRDVLQAGARRIVRRHVADEADGILALQARGTAHKGALGRDAALHPLPLQDARVLEGLHPVAPARTRLGSLHILHRLLELSEEVELSRQPARIRVDALRARVQRHPPIALGFLEHCEDPLLVVGGHNALGRRANDEFDVLAGGHRLPWEGDGARGRQLFGHYGLPQLLLLVQLGPLLLQARRDGPIRTDQEILVEGGRHQGLQVLRVLLEDAVHSECFVIGLRDRREVAPFVDAVAQPLDQTPQLPCSLRALVARPVRAQREIQHVRDDVLHAASRQREAV